VIWLESIVSQKRLSIWGQVVRNFADLFLVQWPALAKRYRHTEYAGAVF
jgi:hypothetical protein